MRKLLHCLLILITAVAVLGGCSAKTQEMSLAAENSDVLYQVSTLNALMQGYYDGVISIEELLKDGDTGVGTFGTLDGEMIVLDGVVYQAKSDGTVEVAPGSMTTPFSCIEYFTEEIPLHNLAGISDIQGLKDLLMSAIEEEAGNDNVFYMTKISGDFSMIHLRSVPKQEKPYRPLSEIADEQKEFIYEDLSGTLVALYCPDYVDGINLPGWHIHFISEDKTKGGHVLDLALESGSGAMDLITDYQLILPNDEAFADLELATDLSEKTNAVEGK